MSDSERVFRKQVAIKAERKLRAQRAGTRGAVFGLSMIGIVGWTVALPTVVGALLGSWLDRHHPNGRSWTLALLVAGLVLGCVNAGRWLSAQHAAIEPPPARSDD